MEEKRNQLVWNTHWEDMRVIASQLHHQATQADVYLHTSMTSVVCLANTTTTTSTAADDENWRSSSSETSLSSGTDRTAFPAHRVILAAASPFLCKVLHDHYLDHRDTCSTIMLPQVSSATLTHILDFVYCGHATIPWVEREKVLEAAQLLQIMSLIACLQPSTVKVEDGGMAASCLFSSGAMASEIKPEMRRGRKRKIQEGSSANETFSNLQSKVKKKVSIDTDHESCEENPLGRSRRKIKSRYSSDDYELSVPELRPVKSKPLMSAPTSKQKSLPSVIVSPLKDKDLSNFTLPCHVRNEPLPLQSDKLCSFVSPPSSLPSMASQSVSSLPLCYTNNPSVLDIKDPENNNPYLSSSESSKGGKSVVSIHVDNVKTSVSNEEGDWCLTPSLDSVCIEVYEKSECSKPFVAISPISTSQAGSSPVIPQLFTETNVTYLKNADPPKQLVKQLLKSLEPPSEETESSLPSREIAMLPVLPEPSDPSLVSPMKELVSTSPAVATTTYLQDLTVQNLPPSLSRSLEPTSDQPLEPSQSSLLPTKSLGSSSSLSDNKMKSENQYEEDGLFTFQVLIKECEGFSESTVRAQCETGDGIGEMEGSEAEKQPGDGEGVDINQWLSEEINNYLQPQANSESSSQLETVVGSPNEPMESSCQNDNNTATNSATTTTIDKNKMSFECEQCGKKFDEMRRCQSHMHLVHREARHMCRYCGRMFKRRCDLLQHERRHKSPALPCKMCGKVFKLPKDLAAHMATHSRERRYKCNICNKELTTVRNLKNHITSFHHKQRTFVCQICNKSFSKSSSLQVHMRSVHTGERPFSCNVCSKNFHDPALLKIHQAIHTGEQKYSCKVCGRGFTQYSNMISHQRVHTNKRPYTCTVCKETFKTKDALMKHKWTHSGLKPLQCQQCSKAFRVRESYERHMLKCHNELGHLPAIYFEVPEQQVTHEGPLAASSSCSVVEASSEQGAPTLHISSDVGEKILSHDSINKDLMEDISPVVQLMGGMTEEAGQVQITYPLLTSNPEFDDSHDIPISSHTQQVYPVTGPVQSIDVGALLSDEVNITGCTELVSSEDRMRSELTASIGDSVNSECKNVVILDKFTEDNSAIHSQINSSSTSNIIWMPDDSGVMENDGNLDGKTNIFIVSDETFPEADASMPVLTSGLVSPVVQTVILNTPDADV